MRIPQWFVLAWVIVIVIAAVGASVFAYTFVRDRAAELDTVIELPNPPQLVRPASNSSTSGTPSPTGTESEGANANPTASTGETVGPTPAVTSAGSMDTTPAAAESGAPASTAVPAWNDPRRVSVLLLGIDQRAGETGTFPTDTIILLSLDPVGQTAAILSVPRDLWVDYPGVGRSGRINGANIIGDEINYPGGGGPAFAVKTVEKVLGVPIQYYVLINFEVFYKLIDTIGPIKVCPPEPITDDQYPDGSYGTIKIHFDAGCQELGSERLLQYARTRHSDSDVGRSSRQQEVIMSVRSQVLTMGGVMALLPEAPSLWNSVQANVRTNLTFDQMLSLANTAQGIPTDNIRQGQISFEDVELGTSPEGDQILVPIGTDIRLKIEDLFRPAGAPSARQ
jgi:LCP family protein required for cell wall assembly